MENHVNYFLVADHLSPPSTTSRLSDSEVSEPDFEDPSRGFTIADKAKNRAWVRQEAASLSGSLGSSSSPPPHDRVKRDISPKSVDLGGLPSGIRYPEVAQNRQIAYSGALRGPPSRRRLPQVCDT